MPAWAPSRGARRGGRPVNAFIAIVRRDLLLAARRKSEVFTALFFFMIVVSLFPLGCCAAESGACAVAGHEKGY